MVGDVTREAPTRIGDFAIGSLIVEKPGVGRIYLAKRSDAEENYAVKVLDTEDTTIRAFFIERGKFLGRLEHPAIALTEVRGTCPVMGTPWTATRHPLALPLPELNANLGAVLEEPLVVRIAIGALLGLEHVEERLGSYGDLRPRNIAVTTSGGVIPLDTGFPARAGDHVIPGAFEFCAPESIAGRPDVDVRADLYALGLCLFQMATGTNPRAGKKDVVPIPDPRAANQRVSTGLARVIVGLTATERDARYGHARDAGLDLVRLVNEEQSLGPRGRFPAVTLDAVVRAAKIFENGGLLKWIRARTARPTPAPASKPAAEEPARAATPPPPEPAEQPEAPAMARTQTRLRIPRPSAGEHLSAKSSGVFFRTTLGDVRGPATKEEPLDAAEERDKESTAGRIVLSEDGTRCYQFIRELGRGGQGIVRLVRVMGELAFDGFAEPVEEAVIKTSTRREGLERERAVYASPNPGIVKLLDPGKFDERGGYIVLERLYLHPFQLFNDKARRKGIDLATAVDTFVNLLDILNGLHTRRENPVVLCDIKPDNIMLRMSNKGGTPSLQEYVRRIAAGAYEPVFMDMGCAQDRNELQRKGGCLDQLLGTPIYLPPESTPVLDGKKRFEAGVYGPKTDVYALTLSFYEYLTGDRPYRSVGLLRFKGRSFLDKCFELKRKRVNPLDNERLVDALGAEAKTLRRILELGIDPDPDARPTAAALLDECKSTFKVKPNYVKIVGEYHYDHAKGLRHMQGRYSRIDPLSNLYLDFRREAARTGTAAPTEERHITVDDWFASRSQDEPVGSDDDTVHEVPKGLSRAPAPRGP